jgi:LytS/YehU family sensor histidine kinase
MEMNFVKGEINTKYFLKNLGYTILINMLIAFLLAVSHIAETFPKAVVISQSIGICIYTLMMSLFWVLKPKKNIFEMLIVSIGITGGILIGWPIASLILQRFLLIPLKPHEKDFWQTVVLGIAFGIMCSYFFISKAKLKMSHDLIQEERIKRLAKEKEALQANLKMLQAQIEPHFLFNTLSNILSLIDTNPVKGKTMLTDLIHYLRTTLSRTRHDLITLDQETEMIRAYLNIIKIRMGDRLRYEILVPESLKSYPFPPMLLQPLVENAVKHGLEPKIEGGKLSIKVTETEHGLKIEVMDTGLGLTSGHGSGVGITNVRERLHLLYGEKGRLSLEENKPNGLRVIIEVPA